ncbi:MAG TPA: type II toxin-antitoxin system VapC family toxin [Brevundimonas sp.]|uniref:type II toxin-antitoxin system VapC family toxin n=1 Tax=Brevundimonas sp. TaxID=1871086 RepID=UPI002E13247C|nr:type II toxin-antitoxin system VapC family toxin [Brevundimonas sp.]
MKIAPDTNLLVRVVMNDDAAQAAIARQWLLDAEVIVLTLPALCETAWVLRSYFGATNSEISLAIRTLTGAANVVVDAEAVAAGLDLLEAGGDFADGVIAASGLAMGADMFVTFDRAASLRLAHLGLPVTIAGPPQK